MIVVQRARSHRGLLLATIIALTIGWLLTDRPVPIYDGIGAPDEPYRYVSLPPGDKVRTQPPTSAVGSVLVTAGVAGVVEIYTDEQGPQAQVFIVGQGLKVLPRPGSTAVPTAITVTLKPLAPDAGSSEQRIDGNIYELSWDAGTAVTQYTNEGADRILLRALKGPPPKATFLFRKRPGDPWQTLATNLAGADVYGALVQGEGDYALTVGGSAGDSTAAVAPPHRAAAFDIRLLVIGALVLALLGAILAVRLLRARADE